MNNMFVPSMAVLLGDVVVGRSGGINNGQVGGDPIKSIILDGVDYYLYEDGWYDDDGNFYGNGDEPVIP